MRIKYKGIRQSTSNSQLVPSNVEINISTKSNNNNSNVNAKIMFSKENIAYIDNLTSSITEMMDDGEADDHI